MVSTVQTCSDNDDETASLELYACIVTRVVLDLASSMSSKNARDSTCELSKSTRIDCSPGPGKAGHCVCVAKREPDGVVP